MSKAKKGNPPTHRAVVYFENTNTDNPDEATEMGAVWDIGDGKLVIKWKGGVSIPTDGDNRLRTTFLFPAKKESK